MSSSGLKSVAVAALLLSGLIGSVQAQPYGRGWGSGMMGPGMMGGYGFGRACSANGGGFAEWRVERLERSLKPTEAQREAFDAFKKASVSASEIMRDGCPATSATSSAIARMQAMETRMESMLKAVKTVRPPLEALYATLSPEQKSIIDNDTYRRRMWRDR